MKNCLNCGSKLPLKPASATNGQQYFYCNNICRQRAYRRRKTAARNAKTLHDKLIKFSQKSVEWYTPPRYIDAVYQVLGSIDLDPASNEQANRRVNADRYYDESTDGLTKVWIAQTVYLNPPYCKVGNVSNQSRWTEKLLAEYKVGNIKEAILLINAATETVYFQRLYIYPICFVRGRIKFDTGDDDYKSRPTTGSAFIYLGSDPSKFIVVFSKIGHVVSIL